VNSVNVLWFYYVVVLCEYCVIMTWV